MGKTPSKVNSLDLDFLDKVAIKTIKKSKIETEADLIRIRREIQIMSSVQHPNIIHIYEGEVDCYPLYSKSGVLFSVREQGEDGAGDGDSGWRGAV